MTESCALLADRVKESFEPPCLFAVQDFWMLHVGGVCGVVGGQTVDAVGMLDADCQCAPVAIGMLCSDDAALPRSLCESEFGRWLAYSGELKLAEPLAWVRASDACAEQLLGMLAAVGQRVVWGQKLCGRGCGSVTAGGAAWTRHAWRQDPAPSAPQRGVRAALQRESLTLSGALSMLHTYPGFGF